MKTIEITCHMCGNEYEENSTKLGELLSVGSYDPTDFTCKECEIIEEKECDYRTMGDNVVQR